MSELMLFSDMVEQLEEIYEKLEQLYGDVAGKIRFSCDGCPDNCCDSYFQHHTYLEWAYLFVGVKALPEDTRKKVMDRAQEYIRKCDEAIRKNERPQIMCPLNEDGRCILYHHRLLVCRTHGVPATITRPDGQQMYFPGCFRCQELVKKKYMHESQAPRVERTPFLHKLAALENTLLQERRAEFPKVQKTIAEMLVEGPPALNFNR